MSLFLSKEMISYDMDLNRNEGEESKIQAKFIHGTGFTIAFWTFKPKAIIPEHVHEHETATTILKGSLRLTVDGRTVFLHAGDSFIIPSWAVHDAEALEPSEVIDVYTPVREDYLARQNGTLTTYLNTSQSK
ncbi:cupin domain-containing protein [Providencia rettgeri]|uniref:Cupin n=3 Tax=Morganellaceae TaxID=1903414 RepID=A0A264VMM1_PRORE|nr:MULTISPECIES: cupin domain-containing protein [Providencia]MBN6367650.1 cupin domain-containing protein [Providencia rettgeri]MDB9567895.1 cupin domain-containing protein [Providencia rettgeri]OZS72551.1 cupin [Providencia rettgeri]QLQ64931.1 cupin domain-containing protein [Providencia rettgeri]QWQ17040.1 cupin domain-containing protein [Providencia rettgeri]